MLHLIKMKMKVKTIKIIFDNTSSSKKQNKNITACIDTAGAKIKKINCTERNRGIG